METFSISYEFVEKYVRFSKPEYIQVYLYLKYRADRDGKIPHAEQIARELDLRPEHVGFILDFWVSRGELMCEGDVYGFPESGEAKPCQTAVKKEKTGKTGRSGQRLHRPSYTMEEIDAVAAGNKAVSGLFYQAETVLHKVLTQSDMEMLYSFVDWLGLPVEVITMLLSYAAKRGKTGRRYLETVAIDWAERGIDTFEAAEEYVTELEARDSIERKICAILGIYDRALTATEKKYISQWSEDPTVSLDIIPLAYDRTVTYTGKLNWNYMNKILRSWAAEGLETEEQVREWEEKSRPGTGAEAKAKSPKKSGFNNYVDTNAVDYGKLEEQLLDMMLDDGK